MIIELLQRLHIRTISPGKTVTANLTSGSGLSVTVEPGADRLSDAAVAAEVEAALGGLLRGYDQATEQIATRARDGSPPVATAHASIDAERELMDQALADIDVVGISARECVKMRWCGHQDLKVRIRPGSIAELGLAGLAAEIDSALDEVLQARAIHIEHADRVVYGDPDEWNGLLAT